MRVRGSMEVVPPIEVNVDTVYIRTNVVRIEEEEFTGWEYDELQLPLREYLSQLTNIQDSQTLALLVSLLMSEVDMLKAQVSALEGVVASE